MDGSRETGRFLDAERRALAEAVVARQYERQPELRDRYGESGRAKWVHDTEYHLSFLAAAVSFASPALFIDYVDWTRGVLTAHGAAAEDVERNLVCLREVLRDALPEGMRKTAIPYVEAALKGLPEAPSASTSYLEGDDDLSQLARQYLEALLRGERHQAIRSILDAVQAGVSVRDIYLQVFQRCQQETGRLWQFKHLSVAQEHYCTAATQLAMAQLYPYLFSQPRKGRRLVAAAVSGELHEFGLRIVTDLFEAEGWDTMYLGANIPAESVVDAIVEYRPDLLLISATMAFHLNEVERMIALVRSSEAGQSVKILIGGYPCNVDAELWRQLGADAYACDATEALATADRLLNLLPSEPSVGGRPEEGQEAVVRPQGKRPQTSGEMDLYDELTRLNNELLTAQRELARKNAQLGQLNERLIEADRSKDEFLATLAHELRNPLTPICTGLELMRLSPSDQTLLEEVRVMMEAQSHHLVRLVDDLLDVSRITSGKITLRKFRVKLATIVQNAVDATRSLIEQAGHELTVTLPPQPIVLEADPTRLVQVFSNLLTNAARYTESGGNIWLTVQRQDNEAVVTVRDTGVGIPADMLDRVFEMFTQVDRTSERGQSGLGIGLMLVKKLTEMHGGTVEARSEGLGQGSEFVVRLPILIEPAQQPPPSTDGKTAASHKLRILVADDNVGAAKILGIVLTKLGNEVRVAHNGLETIDIAAEFRPHLVLMDLEMPKLNGYDTARRMREQPWGKDMVLAAVTGWGQPEDQQRTQEAGFDHHLVKPVEPATLQKLLSEVETQSS